MAQDSEALLGQLPGSRFGEIPATRFYHLAPMQTLFPFAWVDGGILPLAQARIRSDDAGLLFGWGIFETVRLYDSRPFDLGAHLARMRRGARALSIPSRLEPSRIAKATAGLARANRAGDAALRITLTRGPAGGKPALILHLRRLLPAPDDLRRKGATVVTAPWRRTIGGPLAGLKTLNYLEHAMARELAARRGAYESLYLDSQGRVLEGSASSIFAVFGRIVRTPPLASGILQGVTRGRVLRTLRSLGLRTAESRLTLADLRRAGEVFLTNSTGEVIPVRAVDGRRMHRGVLWSAVWAAYRAQVRDSLGAVGV